MEEKKLQTMEKYLENHPTRLYDLDFSLLTSEEIVRLAIKAISVNPYDKYIINDIHTLPISEDQKNGLYHTTMKIMGRQDDLIPKDIPQQMRHFLNEIGLDFMIDKKATMDQLNSHKRYISFGLTEIPQDFRTLSQSSTMKPKGGLWACDYYEKGGLHSAWEDFVIQDGVRELSTLKEGIIFSISPQAKQLVIDSKRDIESIMERYPATNSIGMTNNGLQGLFASLGINTKSINWDKLKEDYDIVVFTERGQKAFDYECGFGNAPLDVPCIVVSNPNVIIDVEVYHNESIQKINHNLDVEQDMDDGEVTQLNTSNEQDINDIFFDEEVLE